MTGQCYEVDRVYEILELLVANDTAPDVKRAATEMRCESLGERLSR